MAATFPGKAGREWGCKVPDWPAHLQIVLQYCSIIVPFLKRLQFPAFCQENNLSLSEPAEKDHISLASLLELAMIILLKEKSDSPQHCRRMQGKGRQWQRQIQVPYIGDYVRTGFHKTRWWGDGQIIWQTVASMRKISSTLPRGLGDQMSWLDQPLHTDQGQSKEKLEHSLNILPKLCGGGGE